MLLDYNVEIIPLAEKDTFYAYPNIQANYSLTGFQISLQRHMFKYIIDYYLTSGLFVIVSWVSDMREQLDI